VDLPGIRVDPMCPTSPVSFHNVEGMFDWCNRPKRSTFSNVQAIDSSRVHIPRTTMGGPWFFFSESTCKWPDQGSACDDSQGRHEEGELLSTMSQHGTRHPLPPHWSLWPPSQRTAHKLWDLCGSKCFFGAPVRRGLPTGVLGQQ
jgi:hypothetical protein